MPGNKNKLQVTHTIKEGFSLIEILVAIMLVGIMATIVVPSFRAKDPRKERRQFFTELNTLTRLAWSYALVTGKVQRLVVDFTKGTLQLQEATDKKDEKGEPVFVASKGYIQRTVTWPKQLQIQNFYIEGFDEMERFGGRPTGTVWFFVTPQGLAQPVTMNIVDTSDRSRGSARPISLVLNPFSAQFKEYATFQKP
jgi:type II secretion system protein H